MKSISSSDEGDDQDDSNRKINSNVIAASAPGHVIRRLTNPVKVRLPHLQVT